MGLIRGVRFRVHETNQIYRVRRVIGKRKTVVSTVRFQVLAFGRVSRNLREIDTRLVDSVDRNHTTTENTATGEIRTIPKNLLSLRYLSATKSNLIYNNTIRIQTTAHINLLNYCSDSTTMPTGHSDHLSKQFSESQQAGPQPCEPQSQTCYRNTNVCLPLKSRFEGSQ